MSEELIWHPNQIKNELGAFELNISRNVADLRAINDSQAEALKKLDERILKLEEHLKAHQDWLELIDKAVKDIRKLREEAKTTLAFPPKDPKSSHTEQKTWFNWWGQ